ncbi:TPA: hypothetical protein ACXLK8_005332 [Klebsiella pneumoniae]
MSAVLASLLGAGLSALSSRDAVNDQNRFNQEMYERYKTPMAQARQLRQAGLNPAFALSNIAQGAIQTPEQSAPADTSGMQSLSSSLPTAFLQDAQSSLTLQQSRNQEIRNNFEMTRQLLEISKMSEDITGLKYDNYIKNGSKDMQINIIKQQEQQMYTKTYTDNLLAVGSAWDVATKAAFAKVGQPLEFEKMKFDIAATSANIAYQLKVNNWYDRYSKAQIDSLYDQAAAAIINARSNERNSYVNQYLAPAQRNSLQQGAGLDYQNALSAQWVRRKDKNLFPLTKQSLKLGVQMQTSQSGLLNYQLHDLDYGLNPARRWLGVGSWTPNILLSPNDIKSNKPKSVKGFRR